MVQMHRNQLAWGASAYLYILPNLVLEGRRPGFPAMEELSLLDKVEQDTGLPIGQSFNCLQDVCSFLSQHSET